jgi:hypothetical protein
MKFTEYLIFAILLVPTATVLTAAVICLTAETPAPASDTPYTTVLSAYSGVTALEDQPVE